MSPLLTVDALTTLHRDRTSRVQGGIADVSFTLPTATIAFLLGRSGCGKSTLLRTIAGLLTPESGHVSFTSAHKHTARPVSMLFQSAALWPHLTVLDNVTLAATSSRDNTHRAHALLERLNLSPLTARPAATLSAGQLQRAALARALLALPTDQPGLLLLDEPTSSLDAQAQLDITHQLVSDIRAAITDPGSPSHACLWVTHDAQLALAHADTLLLMAPPLTASSSSTSHSSARAQQPSSHTPSTIIQQGPPTDVYRAPVNTHAAHLTGPANDITDLLDPADPLRADAHRVLARPADIQTVDAPPSASTHLTFTLDIERVTPSHAGTDILGTIHTQSAPVRVHAVSQAFPPAPPIPPTPPSQRVQVAVSRSRLMTCADAGNMLYRK